MNLSCLSDSYSHRARSHLNIFRSLGSAWICWARRQSVQSSHSSVWHLRPRLNPNSLRTSRQPTVTELCDSSRGTEWRCGAVSGCPVLCFVLQLAARHSLGTVFYWLLLTCRFSEWSQALDSAALRPNSVWSGWMFTTLQSIWFTSIETGWWHLNLKFGQPRSPSKACRCS